jgi:hypothetical protein
VIWLNPLALFALAAVAAPILIHILVQRHAERFAFPTLRFLKPTRLAAIQRHLLEDAALLAVRAAILAAAAGALAGPLVVTPLRRQDWDRRIVRAVVVDEDARASDGGTAAYQTRQFTGPSLRDGIRRAVAWLENAPPARRELVVVSPLRLGALDAADVAAIPTSIGIRFESSGDLPQARTLAAGTLANGAGLLSREVTLTGTQTLVRETPAQGGPAWPIDVVHAPAAKAAVDAAKAAVLSRRIWTPVPGRRVRLVVGADVATTSEAGALSQPWMSDAVAHLARDRELQAAADRIGAGLANPRFLKGPWQAVASAANGQPLMVAASSATNAQTLVVVSAAPAADRATPLLMRSIADAVASTPDLQRAEVIRIAERQLLEWSRPAAPPKDPGAETLRRNDSGGDRRWLWLAGLFLIAVEAWLRRVQPAAMADAGGRRDGVARVA